MFQCQIMPNTEYMLNACDWNARTHYDGYFPSLETAAETFLQDLESKCLEQLPAFDGPARFAIPLLILLDLYFWLPTCLEYLEKVCNSCTYLDVLRKKHHF